MCSSRLTSGSIGAGSIRTIRGRSNPFSMLRPCPASDFSACSATPASLRRPIPSEELAEIAQHEISILTRLACALRKRGVAVEEISVGGTPMSRFITEQPGATEMRPGNYVFLDRMQVGLGTATLDDCALGVVSTVVGRPARDRVIFDAGSKTLTSDGARGFAPAPGYGLVFPGLDDAVPDPSIVIERLNEEHGVARVPETCGLAPGDRVRILPNHACVVTNMVDELLMVKGLEIVDRLPVAARGKIW